MKALSISILVLVIAVLSGASAQDTLWSIDKPLDSVPDVPVRGQIFGKEFMLDSATINDHALTLSSKGRTWPDGELIIFVGKRELDKDIVVTPGSQGMLPHIHMKFVKPGKNSPGTLMYVGEYSMRLTFESKTDSEVRARIHVSLPDYKKSYLIGTFTALVK
jgi:hypothetical protein